MAKAEILRKIKEAEARVRHLREEARREAERLLREARAEALGLQEELRKHAEQRHDAIVRAAEAELAERRRAILEAGAKEASALKAKASANVPAAVDKVLERFKGAVRAET